MAAKEKDLIEKLFDPDDDDNVMLYDENDTAIEFEQIAVISLGDDFFAILKPAFPLDDVADDEALVFSIKEDGRGGSLLALETDEELCEAVFDEFYRLAEKA